jgi:hypothetical protein
MVLLEYEEYTNEVNFSFAVNVIIDTDLFVYTINICTLKLILFSNGCFFLG